MPTSTGASGTEPTAGADAAVAIEQNAAARRAAPFFGHAGWLVVEAGLGLYAVGRTRRRSSALVQSRCIGMQTLEVWARLRPSAALAVTHLLTPQPRCRSSLEPVWRHVRGGIESADPASAAVAREISRRRTSRSVGARTPTRLHQYLAGAGRGHGSRAGRASKHWMRGLHRGRRSAVGRSVSESGLGSSTTSRAALRGRTCARGRSEQVLS